MKTKILSCFMLILLCVGCSRGEDSDIASIREYYRGLTQISAVANVAADSGVIMEYTLAVTRKDGECAVTVKAPEDIAGLTAIIRGDSGEVKFEELELEALLPQIAGFTPIDCVDGIIRTIIETTPNDFCGEEKLEVDCWALNYETFAGEHKASKKVWLDKATLKPIFGELYLENDRILHFTFESFECE